MKRIPRPLNSTQLSRMTRKNKELRKDLFRLLIKAHISGNLFWPYITQTHLPNKFQQTTRTKQDTLDDQSTQNKKTTENISIGKKKEYKEIKNMELSTLSLFLGISVEACTNRITKVLVKEAKRLYGKGNSIEKGMIEATRAISNRLLLGHLDKALNLTAWAAELQAVSRIKGYHAGTVVATNGAIGMVLQNDKQTLETLKYMVPNQTAGVTINNTNNNNPTLENNQYLTPTMAIGLIEQQGLNPIPQEGTFQLEALKAQYQIDQGPNVQAISSDAQGAKLFDLDSIKYLKHEDRREAELNIVDGQVQ